MKDTLLLRDRFALDDRTFTVLAEPWYDAPAGQWRGRYLYLPLDRSVPGIVTSGPAKQAKRRDDLVRLLERSKDRDLARALRAVLPPVTRRA